MFDTHCHLNLSEFSASYKKVINDARACGVDKFLIPGTDIKSSRRAVEIAEEFKGVYAAVGLHPTNDLTALNMQKLETDIIELAASSKKVIAIGETGLDYYKYSSSPDVQKTVFKLHYKLAKMLGLALIIHNRHATDDILFEIENYWDESMKERIVFHCAEVNSKLIDFSRKYQVFIGIDGDTTYDKNKQEFVKQIPLQSLVLETDSPYLTPEPLRSRKIFPNEPKNLEIIAEYTAKLLNTKKSTFKNIVYGNSLKLYGIL